MRSLFDFLNNRKEVDQKGLLKHFKLNEKNIVGTLLRIKNTPATKPEHKLLHDYQKLKMLHDNFLTPERTTTLAHYLFCK